MGSGASTDKKPLTEVRLKSEIGVLFDDKAKRAFDAAATEGPDGTRVVPWPAIEAYAHDNDERALDPRKCMYVNLKAFKSAREQIDEIARVHIKGDVKRDPVGGQELPRRRCAPVRPRRRAGRVARRAVRGRRAGERKFEEIMTAACPGSGVKLVFAPLKGRDRAGAKARGEYADKTAPCYSWLFDITRGSALCETEDALVSLYKALEADDVDIVRTKNASPAALQRLPGHLDERRRESREREALVRAADPSHADQRFGGATQSESHGLRVFPVVFPGQFRCRRAAARDAVQTARRSSSEDVGELVDHVLQTLRTRRFHRANARYWGDDDPRAAFASDWKLLDGLCELLESIQEYAGVVKVRAAILGEKVRAFGCEEQGGGLWRCMSLGSRTKNTATLRQVPRRDALRARAPDPSRASTAATA